MPNYTDRYTGETLTTRQRQDRAFELRSQGYTLRDICDRLGFSGTGHTSRAIASAANRRPRRQHLRRNPFDRTFGVEIEVVGLTTSQAAFALEAAGIACEARSYTHSVMRVWKAVTDASVRGCEVVSPILRGEAGIAQVEAVMKALREAGGRVDRSTGLHIHVGVEDLNPTEVANIVDFYSTNQAAFDGLVAPSRRGNANYFSRGFSLSEKDSIVRRLKEYGGTVRDFPAPADRYKHVNLRSMQRYGTLEFRQHQGTLNGTKASAWIRLLLATVCEAAAMETVEDVSSAAGLVLRMGSHLGQTNARTYLLGRAVELSDNQMDEAADFAASV